MDRENAIRIGDLEIIRGENGSRVPFTTNVVVVGDGESALIDAGAGKEAFSYIHNQYDINQIFLTHFHIDHTWGIKHFPTAQVHVNPLDAKKLSSMEELLKIGGNYAVEGEQNLQAMIQSREGRAFQSVVDRNKEIYPFDEEFVVAGKRVQMIHTPGHCESFCCPYFPEEKVMIVGDYDLTSFGPWYNNADSNINQMIASAEKTLGYDVEHYVTLHHKGVFSQEDYQAKLKDYMQIIDEREGRLIDRIKAGVTPEEIVYQEIFYREKNLKQSPPLVAFEKIGIAKHLERLLENDERYLDFYDSFLQANFNAPSFVHYYHSTV
ncbi:MBL fold metallo-hydrolase [Geomicrobium sp. JCM 19039]|uniref:MBL fold metallo-hydrolase n=1 Tax=Geomicrobium sp. JCM 19039 TaxID=1460636 RepID=UPI00045F1609|nr:MBL fold metallo-hydrolase [Geomicrobium sp. JCM 19039]GAK11117.1 dehydrase [Geomicrobium sp. JCM 19039]